jgi:putative AlgH/UPF0301 family transcriptional regulator
MSLRKRILFAMLFAIVGLTADGRDRDYKAGLDAPKLGAWMRASSSRAAQSPWYGGQPALLLPVQFKDPKNLGVGKLLVASRGLDDPNFAQTVVLLVRYDEKGVLGLVLNRRTDVPLSRALDLEAAKNRSDPVYVGGPVGLPGVLALLQSPAKIEKGENIFGGVYLISDKTLFEQTISARPDPSVFHVYVGYAGWTQDQLRAEVQLGAWFVFPADAAAVFNPDPKSLWLEMIQKTELRLAQTEPCAATSQPAV